MDKAASATMRHCMRTGKSLRCQITTGTSKCVATKICPGRNSITNSNSTSTSTAPNSTSAPPVSLRNRLLLKERTLRRYSSDSSPSPPSSEAASSIQGTIGRGEAGISSEISRGKELLQAPSHLNAKEKQIWELLMKELECTSLEVQDISGGCGSMYGIDVVSERFRGLGMLKQQRLVNEVLGEEIKGWHGVQLKTRAP